MQEDAPQASEDSEYEEVDIDRVDSHRKAGPSTSQQPAGVRLPALTIILILKIHWTVLNCSPEHPRYSA